MIGELRCGAALCEEFSINGKLYRIYMPEIGEVQKLKAQARTAMQEDVLAIAGMACKHVESVEVQKAMMKDAMAEAGKIRGLSKEDFELWADSMEGITTLMQAMFRHADGTRLGPDEDALALYLDAKQSGKLEELKAKMKLASGDEILGESSGQKPIPATQPTGTQSSAAGQPSTDSSPESTTGPLGS